MKLVVFWDGRHCELRASIADDGSIELYPVPVASPLPGEKAFNDALKRLGFQTGTTAANRQIREWLYRVWVERGKVDALSANALRELRLEAGEPLTFQDIIDAITLADKD